MHFLLSVVTPVFNEETNVLPYADRLEAAAAELAREGVDLEVVFVDDHSSDSTPEAIQQLIQARRLPIKYIRLSRNSGSHTASAVGLRYASGDAAVLIAVDLQDPPELLRQLVERHRQGFDVVWAVRAKREGEGWWRTFTASVYYAVMRAIATSEMPAQGADFLLIGRKVIDAYNTIPEKHTSLLAMVIWMGYRQTSIEYVKQARHSGTSKWTFGKKLNLFIDSIISFSYVPIRFMSCIGFLMAGLGFAYAISVVIGRLFLDTVTPGTGFAALMTTLLVGQGLILLMLGILGEYLWRTYDEARGRPRFLIEDMRQTEPVPREQGGVTALAGPASARPIGHQEEVGST